MPKTLILIAVLVAATLGTAVAQVPRHESTGEFGQVVQSPVVASDQRTALGGETFEYMLVPFHHTNFRNIREFQDWLDDLGAAGWMSIHHVFALNPKDHKRLFMRRVGGPSLVVGYKIRRHTLDLEKDSVEVWVRKFNQLGQQGELPVRTFKRGGKNYVVTEARTLDGGLQTLGWKTQLAGQRGAVGAALYKRAAKKLAKLGFVPDNIGFSADGTRYFVVGFAETTGQDETPPDNGCVRGEDRDGEPFERCTTLLFRRAKISTPPTKWKNLITRLAKKGYHLADFQLADNTGANFIVVFARVKINGEVTRRTCVVEPLLLNNFARTVERLNSRGADGYEQIGVTFGGGIDKFQFVLCKDIA
jgi:hypothetical protein